MSTAILITSGKGGVGKTTVCAGLGTALAKQGKKTLLIDTVFGLRNLDIVMGLENKVVYDLIDAAKGTCPLKQTLVRDRQFPDLLYLLPASQTKDASALTEEEMQKLTEKLKEHFDYILLDCPPGIGQGFHLAAAGADSAIVVAEPDMTSIRDADRVIRLLEEKNISKINLLLNRIRPQLTGQGKILTMEEISEILTPDLIGLIMENEKMYLSSDEENEFTDIAKRLEGETIEILPVSAEETWFGKIRKIFRKGQ